MLISKMQTFTIGITKTLIDWLAKTNIFLYSILITIIIFVIKGLFFGFIKIINVSDIQFRENLIDENLEISVDLIIDTLIIAPLLETLVFQTLFYFFFKHVNINRWIIITLSAVAFGCYHNYSVFLMMNTFLIGLIFMYMYLKRAEINNSPYISTVSAHFTSNLFVTVLIFVTRFLA